MTIVNFQGIEFDGDTTLEEFATKLGRENGFRVMGDAFRKDILLETYNTAEGKFTAQELLDLC